MKRNNFQKDILGQFFTPNTIVEKMLGLRQNRGRVLEPSAGEGIFMQSLEKNAVGIEIDKSLCQSDSRIIAKDFFHFSKKNKFATIIGNPPYVRFQDIAAGTKKLLDMKMFDRRSNLYLFFIAKCIEHLQTGGELIFITPRDFLKATSAKKLNAKLYEQGSMTHYYELGDKKIFQDAAPNCAIWRWQKGLNVRKMKTGGIFNCQGGQIIFEKNKTKNKLGNFFEIKVGAVSGADSIFTNKKYGNIEMVCSQTRATGKTRMVIYNEKHECLQQHKQRLLNRKIRKFTNENWWHWGRNFCQKEGARIYVNTKTRQQNPFFISNVKAYDGSVLALFPKQKLAAKLNMEKAVAKLNKINWQRLGFKCDGRLVFTQNSLANAPVGERL